MGRLHEAIAKSSRKASDEDGQWMTGVTAIVAENQDPELQHRVKVVIPSIDEDMVFDEWARQMVFCLGNGFGTAFIPPKGSEVVLFGQLGQKYNLFYASLYNEEMTVPDSFTDENTVGGSVPGTLKWIAAALARFAGQTVEIAASTLAKITGQDIHSEASAENKMSGQTITLQGSTVTANADGSMTVHAGGNITVTAGGNLTLQGRVVNKVGPPI